MDWKKKRHILLLGLGKFTLPIKVVINVIIDSRPVVFVAYNSIRK